MSFTKFFYMLSSASTPVIFEAPEDEAIEAFMSIFGHDPRKTSCQCCGPDYAIYEYGELADALLYRYTKKTEDYDLYKKDQNGNFYLHFDEEVDCEEEIEND